MNRILQHLDIFITTAKANLVREFIYRSNFLTMAIVDFIWCITEAAFFTVVYANTPTINGWSKDQSFFFLGVFVASDAIFGAFFQRNFWTFPALINKGNLDTLLTKPASAVFLGLTQNISFTQLFNMGFGIWIMASYGPRVGFDGGIQWLQAAIWLCIGALMQVLVRFFFIVWSFWLERGFTVSQLYFTFYQLSTKPEGFYPTAVRWILKTALPFAFIGSVPSRILMGHDGVQNDLIALVAAATVFIFLGRYLWRKGLRKYQSASS